MRLLRKLLVALGCVILFIPVAVGAVFVLTVFAVLWLADGLAVRPARQPIDEAPDPESAPGWEEILAMLEPGESLLVLRELSPGQPPEWVRGYPCGQPGCLHSTRDGAIFHQDWESRKAVSA